MLRMNQSDEIKELQRQGLGPQEIAGRLKLNRKTAAKYMKVEDFNGALLGKKASASKLDPWKPKIDEARGDFGEADGLEGGLKRTIKYLCLSFPHSNGGYFQTFGGETAECVCQGLGDIFHHIGGGAGGDVFDNAGG